MADIEIKKPDATSTGFEDVTYVGTQLGLPLPPAGLPYGIPNVYKVQVTRKPVAPPPMALPGSNLPRAINYLADYSGCGWWRLGAPELMLNYGQKMIISSLTTMIVDQKFYLSGITAVKLQRQATPVQKEFVKFLKYMGNKIGAKTIYEVDDVVFYEDIPLFNRCRTAFTDPEIRSSIEEMLEMTDEFLVVSEYMKSYYASKIKNKKITVIPNYAPKMWFDRFYDEDRISRNYNKNIKRPKILITASGTHFDVSNATNQVDDYSHILQALTKTRKEFEWIFQGGYPLLLKPFIDNGEMTFKDWSPLLQFPQGIIDANAQLTIAALADNHFNRSKSFIKLTESAHLGLPFVGQDMQPYQDAFYKFNTGDELIDNVRQILNNEDSYMKICRKSRIFGDDYWLDDEKNLMKHVELYTTPYGSKDRKYLLECNPEQKTI